MEITAGRSLYASRRTSTSCFSSSGLFESVSLTPPLRIGGSEVDRGKLLAAFSVRRCRRESAYVPRGNPVDGVEIVRNADTVASQLFAKAYRSRTGHRGGLVERADSL